MADELYSLGNTVLAAQPFSVLMGAELTHFAEGEVEMVLPLGPEFVQHQGVVHSGVISYLADTAITFAGGSALGPDVLTAEYKINYLTLPLPEGRGFSRPAGEGLRGGADTSPTGSAVRAGPARPQPLCGGGGNGPQSTPETTATGICSHHERETAKGSGALPPASAGGLCAEGQVQACARRQAGGTRHSNRRRQPAGGLPL